MARYFYDSEQHAASYEAVDLEGISTEDAKTMALIHIATHLRSISDDIEALRQHAETIAEASKNPATPSGLTQ